MQCANCRCWHPRHQNSNNCCKALGDLINSGDGKFDMGCMNRQWEQGKREVQLGPDDIFYALCWVGKNSKKPENKRKKGGPDGKGNNNDTTGADKNYNGKGYDKNSSGTSPNSKGRGENREYLSDSDSENKVQKGKEGKKTQGKGGSSRSGPYH